jgi:hypothetical protein
MGSVELDITGLRYGRLVAMHRVPSQYGKRAWWRFQCDCGNTTDIDGYRVRDGRTQSCGCLLSERSRERATKHQRSRTREYRAWAAAKTRCYNTSVACYPNYGGRGIQMAPEWRDDFPRFFADMGECPKGYTLERIDNLKGYQPDNCKWATRLEQMQNQRTTVLLTLNGRTLSISAWERELGFKAGTIKARLQRGWSHLRALTASVR